MAQANTYTVINQIVLLIIGSIAISACDGISPKEGTQGFTEAPRPPASLSTTIDSSAYQDANKYCTAIPFFDYFNRPIHNHEYLANNPLPSTSYYFARVPVKFKIDGAWGPLVHELHYVVRNRYSTGLNTWSNWEILDQGETQESSIEVSKTSTPVDWYHNGTIYEYEIETAHLCGYCLPSGCNWMPGPSIFRVKRIVVSEAS